MLVEQEILATRELKVNPKNPLQTPGLHKFSFLGDTGQFLFGGSMFRHADLIHQFKKDEPKWSTTTKYGRMNLPYFDKPTHVRAIVDNTGKEVIVGFRPYFLEDATEEHIEEYDQAVIYMLNRLSTMTPKPIYVTDQITNADLDFSVETMSPEFLARRIEAKRMYKLDKGFFNRFAIYKGKITPIPSKTKTKKG